MGYDAAIHGNITVVDNEEVLRVLEKIASFMHRFATSERAFELDTVFEQRKIRGGKIRIKLNFGGWLYHGVEDGLLCYLKSLLPFGISGTIHWKTDFTQTRGKLDFLLKREL